MKSQFAKGYPYDNASITGHRGDILSMFGKKGAERLMDFLSEAVELGRHPQYYQPEGQT